MLFLYIYVANSVISFLHQVIGSILDFFQFQTKIVIHMYMCICGHQAMVTETSKVNNLEPASFTTHSIMVNNPVHWYNNFLLASISGR